MYEHRWLEDTEKSKFFRLNELHGNISFEKRNVLKLSVPPINLFLQLLQQQQQLCGIVHILGASARQQ
jgi:hypothetical protein